MQSHKFTFATVVYEKELPLLELQARSFARWVAPDMVEEILVALNGTQCGFLRQKVEGMRLLYGVHAEKVKILDPDLLLNPSKALSLWTSIQLRSPLFQGRLPKSGGWRGHPGWLTQQALKLAFGNVACSRYTVILDAKNIWLNSLYPHQFVHDDGRARTNIIKGFSGRNQNAWFPPSMLAVGLHKDTPFPSETTHFLTPFPVSTEILRKAFQAVEETRYSVPAAFLLHKPSPTEFFIINSYVLKVYGALEEVFSEGFDISTPFSAAMDSRSIDSALLKAETGNRNAIALHSAAWKRFNGSQNYRLYRLLEAAEIVSSWEQFETFFKRISAN